MSLFAFKVKSQLKGEDTWARDDPLSSLPGDGDEPYLTLSQEGTPPIKIRPWSEICTPSSINSVAAVFPNTQKRKTQTPKSQPTKAVPIKRSRSSPNVETVATSPAPTSCTPGGPNKNGTPKRHSIRGKPCAENSGMKADALLKYFTKINTISNSESTAANVPQTAASPKLPGSGKILELKVCIPLKINQIAGSSPIEVIDLEEEDNDEIQDNPVPATILELIPQPRSFHQQVVNTPPKVNTPLNSHQSSPITKNTLCPQAPPKITSTKRMIPQETTPPPAGDVFPNRDSARKELKFESKQKDQDSFVCSAQRQVEPASIPIPPQQKNPDEVRARVEAYYKRLSGIDSGSEDEDSAKENVVVPALSRQRKKIRRNSNEENVNPQPQTAHNTDIKEITKKQKTITSAAAQYKDSVEISLDSTPSPVPPIPLAPVSLAAAPPMPQKMLQPRRRYAGEKGSTMRPPPPPLVRKKSIEYGIPLSLVRALKKKFGELDVERLDDKSPLLIDMKTEHLSFLLERCSRFQKNEPCSIQSANLSKATPKSDQNETFEFFTKEVEKVLENTNTDTEETNITDSVIGEWRQKLVERLLDTVELLYQNLGRPCVNNCYVPILLDLLPPLNDDRRRAKDEETLTLKLASALVKLIALSYEDYAKTDIKIRYPFIARLFQGPLDLEPQNGAQENVRKNLRHVVDLLFLFEESPKEFELLMTVLNLAIRYFSMVEDGFVSENGMIRIVWKAIKGIKGRQKWGLAVIKNLSQAQLGKGVCQRILRKNLNLKRVKIPADQRRLDTFLKFIAASSLVVERVPIDYNRGSKTEEEIHNFKGESRFHRACALQPNNSERQSRKVEETKIGHLENLLVTLLESQDDEDPSGDINAVDNNGNTCLHDAAQNGRLDAIRLLAQKCWNPEGPPSRTNLDILAQDRGGNTPLHIALSSLKMKILGGMNIKILEQQQSVVEELIRMVAQAPKTAQILFATKNKADGTVFGFDLEKFKNPVGHSCFELLNDELERVTTTVQGLVTMSPQPVTKEALIRLQESPDLQRIVAYWEHFDRKL